MALIGGAIFWNKDVWPPNSPDLNPLDYFFFSEVERRANKSRHANIDELRAAIRNSFKKIDRDVLNRHVHASGVESRQLFKRKVAILSRPSRQESLNHK